MGFNLERFIAAQAESYLSVIKELKAGEKETHWMWFIFPQLSGLGRSSTAKFYGISGREEARAYLGNDILRGRLIECAEAVFAVQNSSLINIFGNPDQFKFCSSMTLFEAVDAKTTCFTSCLEKYCNGRRDEKTLRLLDTKGIKQW